VVPERALGSRVRLALLLGFRLRAGGLDPLQLGLEPGDLLVALDLVACGFGRVVTDDEVVRGFLCIRLVCPAWS